MTNQGVKALIEATALETEVQGMIAENQLKISQGFPPCFNESNFIFIAEEMRKLTIQLSND